MAKMFRVLRNHKGFVELEYLMAAGIGLIVIAAFATGIQQMTSLQRKSDISQDANFLVEDLSGMLKSGDFCTEKFGGIPVPPIGTAQAISFQYPMMDVGTEVTLQEGAEPMEGVRVKVLRLLRVPGITPEKITVKAGDYFQVPTVLRVETEKIVNGKTTSMKSRDIPLTVSLDSSDKIRYCNKDALAAQSCFESGGTYNEKPDIAKGETTCLPANHCDYGGTYSDDPANGFPNPLMNPPSRACPAGYTAERSGTVSSLAAAAKYNGKISNNYYGISTCIRCGPVLKAQGSTNGGNFTDSGSMEAIVGTIASMPGSQAATAGHITSTGTAAGVFPVPPPPPPPPLPPPAPPAPNPPPNGPADPACTGSIYTHPTAMPPDCPSGTTAHTDFYDTGYGYDTISYCSCDNYVPPPPPPTACDGAIANYKANYGSAGKCATNGEEPAGITCSEYKQKKKPTQYNVLDSCTNAAYWYSNNGAAPYYVPRDPCLDDPGLPQCFTGYPYF